MMPADAVAMLLKAGPDRRLHPAILSSLDREAQALASGGGDAMAIYWLIRRRAPRAMREYSIARAKRPRGSVPDFPGGNTGEQHDRRND